MSADNGRNLRGGITIPDCHSMFKTCERKEFPSRLGGTLADNRPTTFDAKKAKWSAGMDIYLKSGARWQTLFNDILKSLGRSSFGRTVRGEVAERLNAAVC